MIRSLPQSKAYTIGFKLYVLLYFVFLFAPLLVTCVLAFNDSQFPSLPWKGFTLDWFTADRPDLWRRTVYRFVVRTTPNVFMDVLDCPDPSTLTPVRNRTTTALQSLALLNNPFMILQSERFAGRLEAEAGEDRGRQIALGFGLAFGRRPSPQEEALARALLERHGLFYLCRMLFNASEFIYID